MVEPLTTEFLFLLCACHVCRIVPLAKLVHIWL